MAEAETNKSTNPDARSQTREAQTTTRTPAGGAAGAGGAQGSDSKSAPAGAGGAAAAQNRGPRLFVDGAEVTRERYFEAAEAAGWDVQFLRERGYYPAVTTAKK
jgi:hypothetical protein